MELEFTRWLREHVPTHRSAPLELRDDAALLKLTGSPEVIVTTDTTTDGVDFRIETDDPRRIGRQALAANLSDLAAMAATPVAAVISLVLPRNGAAGKSTLELAISLYEGVLPLAGEFDVAIAGGDTNTFDGPLVLSVTAIGQPTARGHLLRSGGQPGDWLLVTGKLGGSILGHMFDFTPRVREALMLHERYDLHAGLDISDGLALDASRLATESGCGVVIYTDRVPISPDAFRLAEQDNAPDRDAAALQHALGDGQDFELLIAVSPDTAQEILRGQPLECGITHVGELTADPGFWHRDSTGRHLTKPTGWLHQ